MQPAGFQGVPGPNELSESTATAFTGLLKGDGTKIAAAVADMNCAAAKIAECTYLGQPVEEKYNAIMTKREKAREVIRLSGEIVPDSCCGHTLERNPFGSARPGRRGMIVWISWCWY